MTREIRPDRVAVYIRWSTEDQGEGTTLAVQSEACRHYVLSQGWHCRDDLVFIDDGYSGGSLDRPALTRLRRAVQQGEVDCVVVFRLDRLSRSVIDTVTLVLQEWADLTHVKSAREPVDTATAMGRQFFYMLISYAEWERNAIRERMFSGKLRRAREGRSPGMPAPYGYKKGLHPGSLLEHHAEAAAVRRAFALAADGLPPRQIAAYLQQHGYPTRQGGPWAPSTIARLLRNPLYAGRLVWGRRRLNPRWGKAPGERKFRAAEPHAAVAATTMPALVSPEAFDRVQTRLQPDARPPAARGSLHLLSGLLRCGGCQAPMQFNRQGRWAYYRCGQACGAQSVPAEPLEEHVTAEIRDRYATAAARAAAARAAQPPPEADRQARAAAFKRLDRQTKRIDRDYRQQRITAAERQAMLEALHTEKAQLTPPEQPAPREADPWASLQAGQQKEILRAFLAGLTARRERPGAIQLELTWRRQQTAQ